MANDMLGKLRLKFKNSDLIIQLESTLSEYNAILETIKISKQKDDEDSAISLCRVNGGSYININDLSFMEFTGETE